MTAPIRRSERRQRTRSRARGASGRRWNDGRDLAEKTLGYGWSGPARRLASQPDEGGPDQAGARCGRRSAARAARSHGRCGGLLCLRRPRQPWSRHPVARPVGRLVLFGQRPRVVQHDAAGPFVLLAVCCAAAIQASLTDCSRRTPQRDRLQDPPPSASAHRVRPDRRDVASGSASRCDSGHSVAPRGRARFLSFVRRVPSAGAGARCARTPCVPPYTRRRRMCRTVRRPCRPGRSREPGSYRFAASLQTIAARRLRPILGVAVPHLEPKLPCPPRLPSRLASPRPLVSLPPRSRDP
jgi:hypothetical protein